MPATPSKKKVQIQVEGKSPAIGRSELDPLEWFRHGKALMPHPADPFPAIAYQVKDGGNGLNYSFCSCATRSRKTCDHLKALNRITHAFDDPRTAIGADAFAAGRWQRLARVLADGCRETVETIRLMRQATEAGRQLVVMGRSNDPLLVYCSEGEDRSRFISRCTLSRDDTTVPTRADVLQQLASLTLTDNERVLGEKGLKTARQTFESSFWFRFAYHAFREFGEDDVRLHPAVDEVDGQFILSGKDSADRILFHLPVPRNSVKRLLVELKDILANQHGFSIQPLSLDAVFDVSLNDGMDLEIRPMLRLIQQDGELRFLRREDLKSFQYGNLYYIKELGVMVEDHYPNTPPAFADPVRTVVQRSQVPRFLAENRLFLQEDLFRLDERVRQLKIMTTFDHMEISPQAIDQDWYWLSVIYGQGEQSVSLAAILEAKQAGQRYVAVASGWVDCEAPVFAFLDGLAARMPNEGSSGAHQVMRLSRADIFRLNIMDDPSVQMAGDPGHINVLRHLLALKPSVPPLPVTGMISPLRGYQQRGVQWLWFLYENGFGGLLCDDMGLGKTHQAMAFLLGLREAGRRDKPFIVVCPTSVISHWERKIAEHAPDLKAAVYHGMQRDLARTVEAADVLITSYGVLRRDAEALATADTFDVAIFDEIQNIKNPDTQTYKAAQGLRARMKLGLTGTPIENRLRELKALLDLAVPGYLGTEAHFAKAYLVPIEENDDAEKKKQLNRLISPFTLRRLKRSVLDELPRKIEDLRFCRLSEEQIKLYRDAIGRRGGELRQVLARGDQPIPYIHVFALLNLLKQICNHPTLVHGNAADYDQHASGKWDLFTELLSESLDSGQKVVVYSQYVGMIDIISRYLMDQKVDFAALTGASRNRGQIIERFANDSECRVFVGSLKAGGVGIDLVAASVVIHYDRWWNAAREDQATDRVHRIGQTRGVQVFKLVTEGTLEEKISAIIAGKRNLMETIVKEDDPDLVKTFSRQELMEMIAPPIA